MILRRLTSTQKDEIVEAYRGGETANTLAEKYSCSSNTINRTVKTLLSDIEYKLLKEKRSKISNKKLKGVIDKNKITEKVQSKNIDDDLYNSSSDSDFQEIALLPGGEISSFELQAIENSDEERTDQVEDKFEEIVPLISNFDFEEKKLDFEIVNQEVLPEIVYMLVDKKVELDVKLICDLPEWSFLPENELKRNAILLFSNQRSAKRSCSRNQRVIKIPDTSVFEVSKSYLLSKGITRLILEDSLIALDS